MDPFAVASSAVLDRLWEEEDFSTYFHQKGYDLRAAAKIVVEVFRQAYIDFCDAVPADVLADVQQEAIDQIMLQMVRNPAFIDIWRTWNEDDQENFLENQAERPMGLRLVELYPDLAQEAYIRAFDAYLAGAPPEE